MIFEMVSTVYGKNRWNRGWLWDMSVILGLLNGAGVFNTFTPIGVSGAAAMSVLGIGLALLTVGATIGIVRVIDQTVGERLPEPRNRSSIIEWVYIPAGVILSFVAVLLLVGAVAGTAGLPIDRGILLWTTWATGNGVAFGACLAIVARYS